MNAMELARLLPPLLELRQAAFVWGPPGIGKSSVVRQVSEGLGLAVTDLRLAMCDPTDLRGIPFYDPERRIARWAPPEFLPREGRVLAKLLQRLYIPEAGRILIDGVDISLADPAWLRRQIGVVLQENYPLTTHWPKFPQGGLEHSVTAVAADTSIRES